MKRYKIRAFSDLPSQEFDRIQEEWNKMFSEKIPLEGDQEIVPPLDIASDVQAKRNYEDISLSNQEMIIERLQSISNTLELHDQKAATSDEVVKQGSEIQQQLIQNRDTLRKTLFSLHNELRKSSFRHRLSIYASVCVLLSTALLLLTLIQGTVVIKPIIPSLITFGAILFWVMSRKIPPPPTLPDVFRDD